MTKRVWTLALLLLVAGAAGCSSAPPPESAGPEPATRLVATLVSPTDITLQWAGQEPDAGSRIVEYATERNGQYTILDFVPPHQTTFTHPDLMPETPFYYRVRPVLGPTSPLLELAMPKGPVSEKDHEGDHQWAPPRTVPGGPVEKHAIRNAATATAAAPTDLQATVMHANGIKFTWADHASDEEGYLLEVRAAGKTDFQVAMVLDPDINSVGLITLPSERTAAFRIRAFFYGASSNVAHQRTGPDRSRN